MGIGQCCTLCLSNPTKATAANKNKKPFECQEDEEEPYGSIEVVEPTASTTLFCLKFNSSPKSKQSQQGVRVEQAAGVEAGLSKPPAQPKKDPPSRKKKVSFSWRNRRKSSLDTGPAYDYIDADGPDPVYSKVDENLPSLRYDYPTFSTRERTRKPVVNEPFYTSASLHSQLYSGGSEDPYSSIISEGGNVRAAYEGENSSSIYDTGYARVKGEDSKPALHPKHNLDALYAKINRCASVNSSSLHHEQPSTSGLSAGPSGLTSLRTPLTPHNFLPISSEQQLEESGSGSIVSGSSISQNPSYRYLTVRESVDVVRERIRRREQEMAANRQRNPGPDPFPLREHYYSTIANEYESVLGDDNTRENNYAVGGAAPSSTSHNTFGSRFSWNANQGSNQVPLTTALSLNIGSRSSPYPDPEVVEPLKPPPPPTSPIPNRVDQPATVILRPVVLSPTVPLPRQMIGSSYHHQPSTTTSEKTCSNPNLMTTRSQVGQSINRLSYSQDCRVMGIPAAVRLSYLHRQPPAVPNGQLPPAPPPLVHNELSNGVGNKQQGASRETAEMQTQTQQSKIPIPLSISNSFSLRSRTPSPTVEAGTQTGRLLEHTRLAGVSETGRKKAPKQLPAQLGNDYVSPVDLGSARGWPLQDRIATPEKLEENQSQ